MKDFNFFSPYLGETKASKNKHIVEVLILISLTVFIGGTLGENLYKTNTLKKEIENMEQYLKDSRTISANKKVEEYKEKIEISKRQYRDLDTILAEMDKKDIVSSTLIDKITAVVPEKVGFKTVSIVQEGIQIQGVAKDRVSIAEFEHNLKGIEGIKEVQISNITKSKTQAGDVGEEEYSYALQCKMKAGTKNENK